jgi:hypothetical protein
MEDSEVGLVDVLVGVKVVRLASRNPMDSGAGETGLEAPEVFLVHVAIAVEVAANVRRTTFSVYHRIGDGVRARVTGITHAIAIGVGLTGVCGVRTRIIDIANAVVVRVHLIEIGCQGAIVAWVRDSVSVGIGLVGIAVAGGVGLPRVVVGGAHKSVAVEVGRNDETRMPPGCSDGRLDQGLVRLVHAPVGVEVTWQAGLAVQDLVIRVYGRAK